MKKIFIALFLSILSFYCYNNIYNIQSTQCLSTIIDDDENLAIIQEYVTKAGYNCDVFFMDEITIPDNDMYPAELRRQTLKIYDLIEPNYDGEFYLNETTGNVYEYIDDVWIFHNNNMKVISPGYINFCEYSLEDLDKLKEDGVCTISKYLSNKNIDFLSFNYFSEGAYYPDTLKYQSMLCYEVSDSQSTSYVFYNPQTQDVFEEIDDGFIWHNMYKTLK